MTLGTLSIITYVVDCVMITSGMSGGGGGGVRGRVQTTYMADCIVRQGVAGGGRGDNNVWGRLHHYDAGHVGDGSSYVLVGFQSRQRTARAIQK